MNVDFSKRELHQLNSRFKDYKMYQKGFKAFMRKGFVITLIVIAFIWLIALISAGFRLDVYLVIALTFFIVYFILMLPIWKFVLKKNAEKMEDQLFEWETTQEEFEKFLNKKMEEAFKLNRFKE